MKNKRSPSALMVKLPDEADDPPAVEVLWQHPISAGANSCAPVYTVAATPQRPQNQQETQSRKQLPGIVELAYTSSTSRGNARKSLIAHQTLSRSCASRARTILCSSFSTQKSVGMIRCTSYPRHFESFSRPRDPCRPSGDQQRTIA
mgnify:CR=1 FL=1